MSNTIIHGVPFSQPFRSVTWICAYKKYPFKIKLCVPGMKTKMGNLRSDFKTLYNPLQTIPLLEENNYTLSESSSILKYLSIKNKWYDLYSNKDEYIKISSTIDSYLTGPHQGIKHF